MAPSSNLTVMEHEILLYWRSANSVICFAHSKGISINSEEEVAQARREIRELLLTHVGLGYAMLVVTG